MTDNVAEIAGKLTEAQRRMLELAFATPLFDRWKLHGSSKALREKGLCVKAWRRGDLLTPLGESVRSYLKGKP